MYMVYYNSEHCLFNIYILFVSTVVLTRFSLE
ncbi:hypothetical protein [Staphylococcus phage vB_SauM-V1SA19]|nr:hypothetical protein [Staphylococcus phage vB_SauM-V1SA19]